MKAAGLTDRPVTWVALAGFMGTGKSRIGWELSRALALHFIDTDKLISKVCGKSVAQIFAEEGEGFFRSCEQETVQRVCCLDHAVISLGGGTFQSAENRRTLLERGPVVVLWANPETVYQRTRHSDRPLLQVADPLAHIEELLESRRAAYEEGTIHVQSDGRPSEEIVEEVVARLWDWAAERWNKELTNSCPQQPLSAQGKRRGWRTLSAKAAAQLAGGAKRERPPLLRATAASFSPLRHSPFSVKVSPAGASPEELEAICSSGGGRALRQVATCAGEQP